MFGRKKPEEPTAAASTPVVEARPGAKNRPTPSRREAEAARRRPLVPADRKAAQQESKLREREERARYREAMYRGEEWALGPRDRGSQRQLVRDMVDSRWNLGEFLLPVMLVALPISLLNVPTAYTAAFVVLYGMIIATVVDAVLLGRRAKKAVREQLHEEPQKGLGWYAFTRSVQLRGGRMPRPRMDRKGNRIATHKK